MQQPACLPAALYLLMVITFWSWFKKQSNIQTCIHRFISLCSLLTTVIAMLHLSKIFTSGNKISVYNCQFGEIILKSILNLRNYVGDKEFYILHCFGNRLTWFDHINSIVSIYIYYVFRAHDRKQCVQIGSSELEVVLIKIGRKKEMRIFREDMRLWGRTNHCVWTFNEKCGLILDCSRRLDWTVTHERKRYGRESQILAHQETLWTTLLWNILSNGLTIYVVEGFFFYIEETFSVIIIIIKYAQEKNKGLLFP